MTAFLALPCPHGCTEDHAQFWSGRSTAELRTLIEAATRWLLAGLLRDVAAGLADSGAELRALQAATAQALADSHALDLAAVLRDAFPHAREVTVYVYDSAGDPFYDPAEALVHPAEGHPYTVALPAAAAGPLERLSTHYEPAVGTVLQVDLTFATCTPASA